MLLGPASVPRLRALLHPLQLQHGLVQLRLQGHRRLVCALFHEFCGFGVLLEVDRLLLGLRELPLQLLHPPHLQVGRISGLSRRGQVGFQPCNPLPEALGVGLGRFSGAVRGLGGLGGPRPGLRLCPRPLLLPLELLQHLLHLALPFLVQRPLGRFELGRGALPALPGLLHLRLQLRDPLLQDLGLPLQGLRLLPELVLRCHARRQHLVVLLVPLSDRLLELPVLRLRLRLGVALAPRLALLRVLLQPSHRLGELRELLLKLLLDVQDLLREAADLRLGLPPKGVLPGLRLALQPLQLLQALLPFLLVLLPQPPHGRRREALLLLHLDLRPEGVHALRRVPQDLLDLRLVVLRLVLQVELLVLVAVVQMVDHLPPGGARGWAGDCQHPPRVLLGTHKCTLCAI